MSDGTSSSILLSAPSPSASTIGFPSPRPDSPSASTFLRTAATLDGLARQLGDINDEEPEEALRCCCGALVGEGMGGTCAMMKERDRMEDRMKLSGEIGQALLQRYEALEKKLQREVERYEHQLDVKRKALEDSIKRVKILEKANTTHLQQYAEMTRKNEALEKRFTQSLHTQTLTQQSLTHVRSELTALRSTSTRQNLARASNVEVEEKLLEVEKRYENARDNAEAEARTARDETRKRKRAEARIAELEEQLSASAKSLEETKEARAKDAEDLLTSARERLSILHAELSETFSASAPSETPEYQRTLEDLVANNALLKHDASELSAMLVESREEVKLLRDEVDELRTVAGVMPRSASPGITQSLALAAELSRSTSNSYHSRTESSPMVGTYAERLAWSRMSVSSNKGISAWEHHRKSSTANSIASISTDGLTSPGLGMGPIGEYGGILVRDEGALSPPLINGRESPKPVFRTSPSGGIAYVLNGVPKKAIQLQRPPARRTYSMDKRRSQFGVEPIAESSAAGEQSSARPESPISPGSEYHPSEASRKRRSILLSRHNTVSSYGSVDYSSNAVTLVDQGANTDLHSPMSESGLTSPDQEQRVGRKSLMLLTSSKGVQTEPEAVVNDRPPRVEDTSTSTGTSPRPHVDRSETSSLHEARLGSGTMVVLVDHLSKLLNRLRTCDIASLNRRLKKHNLPGDVAHLSKSSLRLLEAEVSDLRQHFKGALDASTVTKKEFTLLLKLLKEVFADLVDLQAIVNDVTIDPSLAKRLQKDAYKEEEEVVAKGKPVGGLGWIAAPITKFFVTPAADTEMSGASVSPRPGRVSDRGRLQPGTIKAAPKQLASTSATTTHVSVEFGGAGMIRRATPATPAILSTNQLAASDLVKSTEGEHTSEQVQGSSGVGEAELAGATLRAPPTLRPQKSRANRNELLGIFAGATRPVSPAGGPWQGIGHGQPGGAASTGGPAPVRTIRAVSSQQFRDKTIRPSPDKRKKLSPMVDAMIEQSAQQLDENDPSTVLDGSFDPVPPLLQRQLRPRGLSDSSIRSTYISHGTNPSERLITPSAIASGAPVPRQMAYAVEAGTGSVRAKGAGGAGGGLLESISNRFYSFRAPPSTAEKVTPATIGGATVEDASGTATTTTVTLSEESVKRTGAKPEKDLEPPKVAIISSSPPQPIPVNLSQSQSSSSSTASSSRRSSAISPPSAHSNYTSHGHSHKQNGILGRLASSLAGVGEGEDEMDDDSVEDLGAAFRQRGISGRGLGGNMGTGKSWR